MVGVAIDVGIDTPLLLLLSSDKPVSSKVIETAGNIK